MRDSKILKLISYILIPILIGTLILSISYEILKADYEVEKQKDDEKYFQSDEFLSDYMDMLSNETSNLIYRNSKYPNIQDGDYYIYFSDKSNTNNFYNTYYEKNIKLENMYFMIIYKNKVFTNVELTVDTDSVDKIREYISEKSQNSKYANLINGEVSSNSEVIASKSLQYFDYFKNTYYTKNDENYKIYEDLGSEDSQTKDYVYITTDIRDFKIYSSYEEKVEKLNSVKTTFSNNIVKSLEKYDSIIVYCIPVSAILLVLIGLYLILAIGHVKGKDEIELNDLDKIPLEIIVVALIILIPIICIGVDEIINTITIEKFSFITSCLVGAYFTIYVLFAIFFNTFTKRIKAKIFWKTTITGKFFSMILKFLKQVREKIKTAINGFSLNIDVTTKLVMGLVVNIILFTVMILVFNAIGVVIDLIIIGYYFYKLLIFIDNYKKIENYLENMCNGNLTDKLNETEFLKEYRVLVSYINNVSNGFENALDERIKSERLKTELITNVSHDIKTPLTSIINYVDLLKKEKIESKKTNEYIEVLDKKSQRLKKLIEDLVEASKASSGNLKLDMNKICLTELIKQSIGEFEDKFKEKELEIVATYPKENINIMADNRYLYRVIENLFSNVSKYALEKSRVYIDVQRNKNKVKVIIKNISKEKLNISVEELMQRFVRGDKSRTTEGSGLGLSISQDLTNLQNGKLSLSVDGDLFKVELEFEIIK